jgi:uncharacterized Fe-S center protein
MGRAIDMEKRQGELERRLQLVEDALEELSRELVSAPKVHHVDLHSDIEEDVKIEGKEIKSTKTKKTTEKKSKVKVVESLL